MIGTEKCRRYPSGNYKPIGLLHEYGEDDRILFGLLTGSYKKNKSGGVLRKNASSFTNEVNKDTDGTFTGTNGIVKTLNSFRIARYDYGDGTYNTADNCIWNKTAFNEGECSNWGNPLSEIYLESLRYFGGLTSSFATDDTAHLSGIPAPAWVDPLDEDNWCAHCDIILINASESSYDHDCRGRQRTQRRTERRQPDRRRGRRGRHLGRRLARRRERQRQQSALHRQDHHGTRRCPWGLPRRA